MEYLRIPANGGIDLSSSFEGRMPITNLYNFEVLPGGGLRRINGTVAHPAGRPSGNSVFKGMSFYDGKIIAARVDGVSTKYYAATPTDTSWTLFSTVGLIHTENSDFAVGNIDGTPKLYATHGLIAAFSWDGTTVTAINTGMSPDRPNKVAVFKNRLWLSFGPSLQFSQLGNSLGWSVELGAGEIKFESDITELRPLVGNTLGIWTRNSFHTITGTNFNDFTVDNVNDYGNNIGAQPFTVQQMGNRTMFVSDNRIVELQTAQEFGDFNDIALSAPIEPIMRFFLDSGYVPNTAWINRRNSSYNVLYSNGEIISVYFAGRQVTGLGRSYLSETATASIEFTLDSGESQIWIGAIDGDVHQVDVIDAKNLSNKATLSTDIEVLIPGFTPDHRRVMIHEVIVNVRIEPTSGTIDEPRIYIKLQNTDGFTSEEAWLDDTNIDYGIQYVSSGDTAHYGRYRAKFRWSCSNVFLGVSSTAPDDPYIVESIMIGYTPLGQDISR